MTAKKMIEENGVTNLGQSLRKKDINLQVMMTVQIENREEKEILHTVVKKSTSRRDQRNQKNTRAVIAHQKDQVEKTKKKIKAVKSRNRKNLIILVHQKNQNTKSAEDHGHAVIPLGTAEERDLEAYHQETEDEIALGVNHHNGECDSMSILWIHRNNIFIYNNTILYKFTSKINLG